MLNGPAGNSFVPTSLKSRCFFVQRWLNDAQQRSWAYNLSFSHHRSEVKIIEHNWAQIKKLLISIIVLKPLSNICGDDPSWRSTGVPENQVDVLERSARKWGSCRMLKKYYMLHSVMYCISRVEPCVCSQILHRQTEISLAFSNTEMLDKRNNSKTSPKSSRELPQRFGWEALGTSTILSIIGIIISRIQTTLLPCNCSCNASKVELGLPPDLRIVTSTYPLETSGQPQNEQQKAEIDLERRYYCH